MSPDRRTFLQQVSAGMAAGSVWLKSEALWGQDHSQGHAGSWTDALLDRLESETGVRPERDTPAVAAMAEDYGRILKGSARAIVYPRSTKEVEKLVRFANKYRVQYTMRGLGHSQGGQSIGMGNVILKLTRMDRISRVDSKEETITCGPGTLWRALVAAASREGFLPRVLPSCLDLTVGGVLSVGGIGDTTHRYGPLVSNIIELEVITGSGERVRCNSSDHADLFESALAGLGSCAAITSVTMKLRKVKPFVRTFFLLYDDIGAWITDQGTLARSGRCDYLAGACTANTLGLRITSTGRRSFAEWFYGLQVSVEYDDPARPPERTSTLDGLRYYRFVHSEDEGTEAFAARHDTRYAIMHKTGAFQLAHPALECILPVDVVGEVLPDVLNSLPLSLGDGHRLILLAPVNLPRYFITPGVPEMACFSIFPNGVESVFLEEALTALQTVHATLIGAGGKRYLPGWLGMMDAAGWRAHYGDQYEGLLAAKKSFDPNNVFNSLLLSSITSHG